MPVGMKEKPIYAAKISVRQIRKGYKKFREWWGKWRWRSNRSKK